MSDIYEAEGGVNLQEPYLVSDGYFVTPSGMRQIVTCPIEITGSTAARQTGDNKILIQQYSDTTSKKPCQGIALNTLNASGTATDGMPRAGLGEYRRDTTIIHAGKCKMIFVSGATISATKAGGDIAPHPSGFVDWRPGLAYLGKTLEPGVGTGSKAMVYVNTVITPPFLNFYDESVTITSLTGSLTYEPVNMGYVETSADMAVNIPLTWSFTIAPTTGQAYVSKSAKTIVVSLNETASTGTMKVGYWFDARKGSV